MINFKAPKLISPSPAEEFILTLFWQKEPVVSENKQEEGSKQSLITFSIRELVDSQRIKELAWSYTTVATLLLRLEKKGFLLRTDPTKHKISYSVVLSYEDYRNQLLEAINQRYPG